jgi:hypothetical protein
MYMYVCESWCGVTLHTHMYVALSEMLVLGSDGLFDALSNQVSVCVR